MAEESTVVEELKVLDAEDVGSLFLCCSTVMYSHKRMAKKKARVVSWEMAHCSGERFFFAVLAMTQFGIAFCCFFFGLRFCRLRIGGVE